MKKQGLITIFFAVLTVYFAAVETGHPWLQYASKPLLIPLLILFFNANTARAVSPLKKWMILALLFSWAGDVLLLFQAQLPDFFLFGLSAFLLAHIFYIVLFQQIRAKEGIRGKALLLLPVILYYAALMIWLSPYLGDMAMPVRIYGIVISFMLVMALHLFWMRNKPAAGAITTGALFFIASDSILAIDKFFQSFSLAGAAIMITYGLAQYLLVRGTALYITGLRK